MVSLALRRACLCSVFGLFWGTIGLHAAFTTFIFSFVICYFFDNNTRLRPEPDVQHVMERLVHVINATVHSVQRPSAECCQPENWTVRYGVFFYLHTPLTCF